MGKELVLSVTAKDLDLQFFRCHGKGGQKVNKTSSGVRIIHRASGAKGECQEERSQSQNKKIAFKRMAESDTFQKWLKLETYRRIGDKDELKRKVDDAMREENLRIEMNSNGKWELYHETD